MEGWLSSSPPSPGRKVRSPSIQYNDLHLLCQLLSANSSRALRLNIFLSLSAFPSLQCINFGAFRILSWLGISHLLVVILNVREKFSTKKQRTYSSTTDKRKDSKLPNDQMFYMSPKNLDRLERNNAEGVTLPRKRPNRPQFSLHSLYSFTSRILFRCHYSVDGLVFIFFKYKKKTQKCPSA